MTAFGSLADRQVMRRKPPYDCAARNGRFVPVSAFPRRAKERPVPGSHRSLSNGGHWGGSSYCPGRGAGLASGDVQPLHSPQERR